MHMWESILLAVRPFAQAPVLIWSLAQIRSCVRSPEVYASDDSADKFRYDFVNAWVKVMNNDQVDIA